LVAKILVPRFLCILEVLSWIAMVAAGPPVASPPLALTAGSRFTSGAGFMVRAAESTPRLVG
jgi:hypothetical protein